MKREMRLEGNRPARLNTDPMGLLSIFKSKSPAPPPKSDSAAKAPAAPQIRSMVWRKTAFDCFTAGEDSFILIRGREPVVLPSLALNFLLRCDEFLSLEKHLTQHVEEHELNSLQVEALAPWLPKLIEDGLLISPEDVRARCAGMVDPANHPPPVGVIGFPTGGNRTDMLERCLSSFAANLRLHGRTPELLVTDSSAAPEHRAAFRALLQRMKREFHLPMRYAGEDEKRRFAEALIKRSGCRPSSVEFALFDPLNAGFTCGANRNALLLHEAGRMAVSVDDDVICEMAPMASSGARVSLFASRDPCERWFFADRESALTAASFANADFLGAHESLLGRDIGVLFPPDLKAAEIDVSCVDDAILHRIADGLVRMRTTFFGQVGDTGTPTSCYYFYARGRTLKRLTENEELYRAAFGSRSVVVAAQNPSIGGGNLAPGMTIGLDHRELLPPFFPVLHAEDAIFAAATWLCCSDSVSGHLPFALHHDSGANKFIHQPKHLSADKRVTIFEFAAIVRAILFACEPQEHTDVGERIRTLGRNLSAFAARPPRDFLHAFRQIILQMEADKLTSLEARLRDERMAPDYWRRDLEAFIAHSRDALMHPDFDIPFELKSQRSDDENRVLMQRLLANYGALLEDWPEMVEGARELRERGSVFSTEIVAD